MSLDTDGSQYPIEEGQIVSGDLVEVSAQLDIEVAPGPHELRHTSVYLSFNKVLRVLDGNLLREVSAMTPCNVRRELIPSLLRARPTELNSQDERCLLPRIARRQDYRGPANLGWAGSC